MISPAQQRLRDTAQDIGISTQDLSTDWNQDAVRYSHQGKSEVVIDGALLASHSYLAVATCNELPMMRSVLSQLGIPVPRGTVFKVEDESVSRERLKESLGDFWQDGQRYRCLPAFDSEGHGLASNISDLGDLEMHLDAYLDSYATWMLETQVEGEDLQVLVVGGKLSGAVVRSALRLTGDGNLTLEELIEAHNAGAKENESVVIDAETRQLLRDQAIFLSEVVPAGKAVQVKSPGAGAGAATDVTGELHPLYHEWASKLAEATGLRLFSMDIRCASPSLSPEGSAWTLGLSARPGWLAFEAASGKDIAKLILEEMFR